MDEMRDRLRTEPDQQLSLTDPDARSMVSQAKGTGLVGYNVRRPVTSTISSLPMKSPTSVATGRS